MKIEIPKVVVAVDLGEYAPELAGNFLHIWVNVSKEVHAKLLVISADVSNGKSNGDDLFGWYADIWSQGPQSTHWTLEEIKAVDEQDPSFLIWMINKTSDARKEHLEKKKKV